MGVKGNMNLPYSCHRSRQCVRQTCGGHGRHLLYLSLWDTCCSE